MVMNFMSRNKQELDFINRIAVVFKLVYSVIGFIIFVFILVSHGGLGVRILTWRILQVWHFFA